MLIAIIAGIEAMVVYASRSKQGRARRQQLLTGNSLSSVRALPFIDGHMKKKTAGATRFQSFLARKLAEIFRMLVHTQSFEYLLLHLIRTASNKRRHTFNKLKRRVTL